MDRIEQQGNQSDNAEDQDIALMNRHVCFDMYIFPALVY